MLLLKILYLTLDMLHQLIADQAHGTLQTVSHRKIDHVIHYRDMEFFDDDVEYQKRYYHANESLVRLSRLISKELS